MQSLTEKQYRERVRVLVKWAEQGRSMKESEMTKAEAEMYHLMCNLYATYRVGGISADEGAKRKKEIMNRFWSRKREDDFRTTMAEHYAKQTVRIESAANAYAKDRTLENADKLYKALYGMEPTKKEDT